MTESFIGAHSGYNVDVKQARQSLAGV